VATAGTGAGTNVLHRSDLSGKTGTTNDAKDGWFAGYQPTLVAVAWMGYDQPKSLGSREFGAQLALPIWVDYMGQALRGVPQVQMPMPEGVTTIGGELYYADMTPGNGFVASIGTGGEPGTALAGAGASEAVGSIGPAGLAAPAAPPPSVSSQEKKQILNLFNDNRP
jgi:penicillin-binding protein 1A